MNSYNKIQNTDNVFYRDVTLTILDILNKELYIEHIVNGQSNIVEVPFLYNAAGDERFWQDLFLQHTMNPLMKQRIVEGNVDVLPRGHLTLESISIQASNSTNRFINAEYTKIVNGENIAFVAPTYFCPQLIGYTLEIRADGRLNLFKLVQRVIEVFYKVHSFKFLYGGMVIPAQIGFPEDQSMEQVYQFTFGESTQNKLTLNLECEAYLPIINTSEEFEKSNSIGAFTINLNPEPTDLYQQNTKNSVVAQNKVDRYKQGNVWDERDVKFVGDRGEIELNKQTFDQIYSGNVVELEINPETGLPIIENQDSNIHKVNEFGIPTETLNDVLSIKKNS